MTNVIKLDDYRPKKRMEEDAMILVCPECNSECFHVQENFSIHCACCWTTMIESKELAKEEYEIIFEPDEDIFDGSDS